MKLGEIEKLLADYYQGKTSEEQEELLKSYLETEHVPEHLQPDQKLFQGFHSMLQPSESDDLERKLVRLIDEKENEGIKVLQPSKSLHHWKWITGIVAGLLLMLMMSYTLGFFKLGIERPKDTFSDPREAYRVVQLTLTEVSANLNNGMKQLNETDKEIKTISNEIKEEIQ